MSVGSNDLIQYIQLLIETTQEWHLYDGFHPAVLRALADIAKRIHKRERKFLFAVKWLIR